MSSMLRDLSILHVIAGIHPEAGGTSRVVIDLTDALAKQPGVKSSLVSQSLLGAPTVSSTDIHVHRVIPETKSRNLLKLGLPLYKSLQGLAKGHGVSVIHNHGIWLPANHWACRVARRSKIPLVIQPHGMLEEWALNYRSSKKQLALKMFQYRDLESATLLIATSAKEIESIRQLGLKQPVAIIPNGVNLPVAKFEDQIEGESKDLQYNFLFLSRIHPIKGLINLVEAWGKLSPMNATLHIAGPDEAGHLAEVRKRVQALGLDGSIKFLGMVEGHSKEVLFKNADLFILPSYSENFGVVVAEALAYGTPVISTHGTPWKGLRERGCGWWVEPTAEALCSAMREALQLRKDELRDMGARGRLYAKQFDWELIAKKNVDLYKWVLGEGPEPDYLVKD